MESLEGGKQLNVISVSSNNEFYNLDALFGFPVYSELTFFRKIRKISTSVYFELIFWKKIKKFRRPVYSESGLL